MKTLREIELYVKKSAGEKRVGAVAALRAYKKHLNFGNTDEAQKCLAFASGFVERSEGAGKGGEIMNNHQGFRHEGKRIFFIEGKGKDISFERWRVTLYYEPHLAKTFFFPSEKAYETFLRENLPKTFEHYEDFRAWKAVNP